MGGGGWRNRSAGFGARMGGRGFGGIKRGRAILSGMLCIFEKTCYRSPVGVRAFFLNVEGQLGGFELARQGDTALHHIVIEFNRAGPYGTCASRATWFRPTPPILCRAVPILHTPVRRGPVPCSPQINIILDLLLYCRLLTGQCTIASDTAFSRQCDTKIKPRGQQSSLIPAFYSCL